MRTRQRFGQHFLESAWADKVGWQATIGLATVIFGHLVLAWTGLQVLLVQAGRTDAASEGRARAARYFFHYELPKIPAWLKVVETRDLTCADTPEDAF